jgi:hypothetical protein
MKHLVGRKAPKESTFLGEKVTIQKLTTAQINGLQALAKRPALEGEDKNITTLRYIIRQSVIGAGDVTDEQFDEWPLEDLGILANEIVVFSGISGNSAEAPAEATSPN